MKLRRTNLALLFSMKINKKNGLFRIVLGLMVLLLSFQINGCNQDELPEPSAYHFSIPILTKNLSFQILFWLFPVERFKDKLFLHLVLPRREKFFLVSRACFILLQRIHYLCFLALPPIT